MNEERPSRQKSPKDAFAFDRYNTYDEIIQFLNDIHSHHPTTTQVFSIGNSFENRPIYAIKITKNESNPILFIDANIHAR